LQFLDTLVERAAAATCDAVAECCSADESEAFFSGIANHPRLEDIADQFPPNAPLDAETCPDLVSTAYETVSLGSWIAAAREGLVTFDLDAANDCLEALDAVGCDVSFSDVFFSGECFGFTPPYGAGQRRAAFDRFSREGDACVPLTDGTGGAFFGTCDPSKAWCAFVEQGRTRIVPDGEAGVCVPVASTGEACGFVIEPGTPPAFSVCQQGLECNLDNECVAPNQDEIAMGQACYDSAAFTLLGDCVNSYCDILGSNECVALKNDGANCTHSYECGSDFCEAGVCTAGQFCDGEG